MDHIGYDSAEVALELIDALDLTNERDFAVEMGRLMGTTCDSCGTRLGVVGIDPNHHLGEMRDNGSTWHYCAAHCPGCN